MLDAIRGAYYGTKGVVNTVIDFIQVNDMTPDKATRLVRAIEYIADIITLYILFRLVKEIIQNK